MVCRLRCQLHRCHVRGALTRIDGLESLIAVGGTLQVNNNDALTSIDGMSSLTPVGGNLGECE